MYQRLPHYLIIATALLSLTSCATIFNGEDPLITIDGYVDEPVTVVTEKGVYRDVNLPVEVKVNRHGYSGQRIQVHSDSHEFDDIVLEKKDNGLTAYNYFLGNIPGFIIDMATNSNVSPRHTHYLISPKGEGEMLASTEPFRPNVPVNRPHAGEKCHHEIGINVGLGSAMEDVYYDAVDKHVSPYGFDDGYTCLNAGEGLCAPLSLDYMYNINRRLAVGLTIGKGHIWEDKWEDVNIPAVDEESEPQLDFYEAFPEVRGYYVMPSIRYKWWIFSQRPLALYSQLSLGYARTRFSVDEVKDKDGKVILPAYSTTNYRRGYQITLVGMEFGRGHLRSFVEIGKGYKGYFNTGVKLCF